MKRLAIVIPAYKSSFLDQTISSIANQTCKDFTLYIGDDASPYNLYSIVDKYSTVLAIKYKKFPENVGGCDLVGHWNRCLDMIYNEEWVWLFSDDDVMQNNCVENFYKQSDHQSYDLYHFNVKIIDRHGKANNVASFPEVLTAKQFFLERMQSGLPSFVVEYIFKRKSFLDAGGFEKFDLAWGSDDALWIKLSERNGIKTISQSNVFWRSSGENISSIDNDRGIQRRKFLARIEFAKWVLCQVRDERLDIKEAYLKTLLEKNFLFKLRVSIEGLPFLLIIELIYKYSNNFQRIKNKWTKISWLYIYRTYRKLISTAKGINRFILKRCYWK